MTTRALPPSGTRDFVGDEARRRSAAFDSVARVFDGFGFDPLNTPVFENLDVIVGKYGEEASKLIFKILKRGAGEATGQADLALRYDHTVPLARFMASQGSGLGLPFKRYAVGPVWRADRPQAGRLREFTQCDLDTVGSTSPLADAEIVMAMAAGLDALEVEGYVFQVNSRKALYAMLGLHGIDADVGPGVLATLDKIDTIGDELVAKELVAERDLTPAVAESLVGDVMAGPDRIRRRLETTEAGRMGLAEVDDLIGLATDGGLDAQRIVYTPRMVRGLDYYTGAIYEVEAPGFPGAVAAGGRYDGLVASLGGPDLPACGGSIGVERILAFQNGVNESERGLDVAITVLDGHTNLLSLATSLRAKGLRVGVYLGSSGKLGRQLQWADRQRARLAIIQGGDERAAGEVTLRDMTAGTQHRTPLATAAKTALQLLADAQDG